MSEILDWQLTHGTVPAVITAIGLLAGATLLVRRQRRWWVRIVPVIAACTVLAVLLLALVLNEWWHPFPATLPFRVLLWIGVGLFAIALTGAILPGSRWWRGGAALLAGVLVLSTVTVKINAYYGSVPTLRVAFGVPPAGDRAFADMHAHEPNPVVARNGRPLAEGWRPPSDMPGRGALSTVMIPAPESHFSTTRQAVVYVPPAYLTANRPLLPVVVLLHGRSGGPADWVDHGRVAEVLDRFAAAHAGLAPVVVIPDVTGGAPDPPCAGAAETYLDRDVPDWIRRTLQVDLDTRHWAVAGTGTGGTCALRLALQRSSLFPTVVDISGQPGVDLPAKKSDGPAVMFTVGTSDTTHGPAHRQTFDAVRAGGVAAELREVPGGDDWPAWSAGLDTALDWLARRADLIG